MPIPCLPTETSFDVQCPVCGRGFLLLTEPTLAISQSTQRRAARRALVAQHETVTAWANAHPNEVFDLPAWDGELEDNANTLSLGPDPRLRYGV